MKADWFGWPIVCAVVLGLLFSGAEQARASSITIVDFEDQGLSSNTYFSTLNGIGVISRGFHYTPGPIIANPSNSDDLHIVKGNASFPSPYNETTVGVTHDDVILTKVGGGTFSIQSFDFAGYPTNAEPMFVVTGLRWDDSTITQYFSPDGWVDGIGGVDDFQTFFLVGDWINLKSVTWTHTKPWIADGRFAIDNIAVNKYSALPEPSTITLLGLGFLCFLGQGWRARKRLKAIAGMI
jgi:hypothetical protein